MEYRLIERESKMKMKSTHSYISIITTKKLLAKTANACFRIYLHVYELQLQLHLQLQAGMTQQQSQIEKCIGP